MNNELQKIEVKINGVSLRFELIKCKKFYLYSFHRNKKILMTGQAPLSHKQDLKMHNIMYFLEQAQWEIIHELEKIKL